MNRQGFKDFNTRLSPENSGKADSYACAISADAHTVCLSVALHKNKTKEYYDQHFGCIVVKKLNMPAEYLPNRDFLEYHRDQVFVGV